MSLNNLILDAQILSAQLNADLGAVDVPEAVVYGVLGLNVFPGQQMYDTVAGGIVEVVNAGVQSVSPDAAGG